MSVFQYNSVFLYISVLHLLFTHCISVVTVGFNQAVYRVNESVGAVEVCASVKGSVDLDREPVVQYSERDHTVVGMMCVFVCLCTYMYM